MRIWSIHPKYLDPQGLVALWREALLARAVLRGETIGYRHHPQLLRFQAQARPLSAINSYLRCILDEAESRGYSFNPAKVGPVRGISKIRVSSGQLAYEWQHLRRKLKARSPAIYRQWRNLGVPDSHPLFTIVAGSVETWERKNGGT
jgi:Pyrimidine dimer DNA glycosylase